jgi:hypothetical protein
MHTDPLWMQAFLAVHIAAGGLCLVLVPVALAFRKGGTQHRRWGRVYYWSMAVLAATALTMALFRPILFLALVAVLSFYLVFSGRRVLALKALARGGAVAPVDWAAAIVTFGACACLAGFGALRPAWVQNMGMVAIVLGTVGMISTLSDMLRFANPPQQPDFWVGVHLQKFLGSYIAIWTAFSSVTLSQLFPSNTLAVWLWPTALGVPAITAASIYYRRKFSSRAREGAALQTAAT